jgi:RNA polymerase sigma-70 factor (ECF subfamily)
MAEPVVAPARERTAGLDAVLASCEPVLLRVAERLCASSADARDLLQDTLERATRQGVPADVRNPRAWLATIMHNLFIDRCRAVARQPVHETLDDDHGVVPLDQSEEPAWGRATIEDVRAALDQIDPVFAQVYRLHTFDQLSYEEIAKRLRVERVTVGTRLNRARKKLREVLVQRLGLEEAP